MFVGLKGSYVAKFVFLVLSLVLYCEYVIYYVVLLQCSWPNLDPAKADLSLTVKHREPAVRVMLIADTHLLGSRRGHWFDKLRREWQMHRAFQTAMTLHAPDLVFVLGDVFDEGLWSSDVEFSSYVARFHKLFSVPDGTGRHVVVGNHDIGFHYGITPYLQERFVSAMDAPSIQMLSVRGVHFVLVNSMAMEGDSCFLCRSAQIHLQKVTARLKCTQGTIKCANVQKLAQYSRPILLQHFPMFRESDAECTGPDQAPEDERTQKFRERWDCLSKESTNLLLDGLNPRFIGTGHTHHGCHRVHRKDIHEWTVPSFSWRNKNNPSFLLAEFSPDNYAVSKCFMPTESSVVYIYLCGTLVIVALMVGCTQRRWRRLRNEKRS